MKQHLIFALANFVFGILLIVLAKVVLPVCHPMDAMTMSCGISTTIDAVLGVALIAIAVVAVTRFGTPAAAGFSPLPRRLRRGGGGTPGGDHRPRAGTLASGGENRRPALCHGRAGETG